MSHVPSRPLNDGRSIPAIGLGTYPLDDDEAAAAVGTALELGYRLIDDAAAYGNEAGVGRAIASSRVPRAELVVTTKLPGRDHGFDQTLVSFEQPGFAWAWSTSTCTSYTGRFRASTGTSSRGAP